VVLTRGYKGKLLGPAMVDKSHGVREVGDEAMLIFKQVPTCVAKDRLEGIKFLEGQGYDIVITDDGMQDERFYKDLTFMVVDGYFGFGNGLIFPAGPLREKIDPAIKRSDFIAIIGDSELKLSSKVPILRAKVVSKIVLQSQKFIAFAGIGDPEKFFRSVIEAEGEIAEKIIFPDHHQYSTKEIENLFKLADKHQAKLITTEKDYTRIDEQFKADIQTLPISLIWEREEKLLERLMNL
jgi:tetraacyldisaccharide 4'-kinase